jgi:hypothetical protein
MKNIIFILSFIILNFSSGVYGNTSCNQSNLKQEIDRLQLRKQRFEAAAIRHEDQAERLEFYPENHLEVRRHRELAKQDREMVKKLEDKIQALKGKDSCLSDEDDIGKLPVDGLVDE